VLLCWDVLGAVEFRFNEANLLGKAVGMDVDTLITAGLVTKQGDKIKMVPVKDRRRDRALEPDEAMNTLFGLEMKPRRRRKGDVLKIHPNDPHFRTALDGCHALALRHLEAGSGAGGIGNARALARQQNWSANSAIARLMTTLVQAAPEALRHEKGKNSAAAKFSEFRAWHELLEPLFGIAAPDWTEKLPPQLELAGLQEEAEDDAEEESEE
jgi:putative DNA methylase